eukprot:jgi/Tetstr1/433774/TSEL_022991.t1
MDAFRTPAPLPVDLPITSRISVNAQHDEQLLTRNEDQQTLRAYVPDPNLPWDPDTYCAPCKSWCHGGHCKIGMLIPTAGLVKDHQCARGKAFYHVISTAPVVGDVVRVLLAKEDRGKVDPTFLTCVAAAGGQPEPKLPKKVRPATLQRAGAALETAAKAEEKKELQVNKAEEEVANAKCRKTELAEAVAEAELSVLGAHVKVADAKIAAGQDSSARERQDARDEMSVFDSSDSEEGEDEIGEEEKEDGEQGEDELNLAYIDQDDEWLNLYEVGATNL